MKKYLLNLPNKVLYALHNFDSVVLDNKVYLKGLLSYDSFDEKLKSSLCKAYPHLEELFQEIYPEDEIIKIISTEYKDLSDRNILMIETSKHKYHYFCWYHGHIVGINSTNMFGIGKLEDYLNNFKIINYKIFCDKDAYVHTYKIVHLQPKWYENKSMIRVGNVSKWITHEKFPEDTKSFSVVGESLGLKKIKEIK